MYNKQNWLNALLVSALILGGSCSADKKQTETASAQAEAATPQSLEPKTFQAKLKETPDAVLLDVRTPEEIEQGKIPGATPMNFKDADFETRLSALDKDKAYFVYCAVGGRSGKTVNLMKEKGFAKIYNLEGGFEAWKEQGLEQSK
jgi:rhodanese-related sulfurtransferase